MSPGRNRRIAFYAPMKAPDHPNPSGDRLIGRLLMAALEKAGWAPHLASRLRSHQKTGEAEAQERMFREAAKTRQEVLRACEASKPALWFTYHCYYKAPDLIGPHVARALSIPYVVAEGYRSKKRLNGPYARFAEASEQALDQARIIFHMQPRGMDALERDRTEGQRLISLPPFADPGTAPPPRQANEGSIRLLTVAMMRPGDKLASYHALAAALPFVKCDWRLELVGDGTAEAEVKAAFSGMGERVKFIGRIDDPAALREVYESADLFLWPGINEAFGMVYLEAQAAALPCIAEDRPGVRNVIGPSGRLVPEGDSAAFARAIDDFAADRPALAAAGDSARGYVTARHGVDAAAALLNESLESLL